MVTATGGHTLWHETCTRPAQVWLVDRAGGRGRQTWLAQTLRSGPAHGASPSPVPNRIGGRGLINIQSCFQV